MKQIAKSLNLAKHSIGHPPNTKKLWTAGDIEVHVGSVCRLIGSLSSLRIIDFT